jgi:hypothetical protein
MAARVRVWLTAAGIGLGLALLVPEDLFPGVRILVFGLVFLAGGLVGEAYHAERPAAAPGGTGGDLRLADGHVEVIPVRGVCRVLNELDPRFGGFLALEPSDETAAASLSRPSWVGREAAPPLLGRLALVSLFVGRDGGSWSASELAEAHANLLRAGRWLEREAVRYGAAVNLGLADTYFLYNDPTRDEVAVEFAYEGDDVGPFERGATLKALVGASRAAADLGFADAPDMFRALEPRLDADGVVWLIHQRQAGRSFAIPRDVSELEGVSLAVCYSRESSFPQALTGPGRVDPVTVVHELLHLFGATDKYHRSLRNFPPRSVTPRDVMRLSESRLSRLRIDPATAAEIGWVRVELSPSKRRRPAQT